ncbi:50S ribosomal protein L15 [Candidatus Daviesbacteria bacterium]|nr:50S ribosomal protein L15 [Candidatus Daviesbacteria bacterium]
MSKLTLSNLLKTTKRPKKRLGRGLGSGKGKTGGRGTKGQKARGSISMDFSGGGIQLYKKIPFLRGAGRNKPVSPKPVTLTLDQLNTFKRGSNVNAASLVEADLISEKEINKKGVKILNIGEIKTALIIGVPISKSALKKIEKAGGKLG